MAKRQVPYQIIFEDSDLLLINKAPLVSVIPDRKVESVPSIKTLISRLFGDIFIVHRIDNETSGMLCLAKNEETHRVMNEKFRTREIVKKYWAIVEGRLEQEEGIIDQAIISTGTSNKVHKTGKSAISKYKCIEKFKKYSVVEVEILTGRQHQIRLHMAHIGHPLMVDSKYGNKDAFMLSTIKKKRYNNSDDVERPLLSRLSLHARSLSFLHPRTEEPIFWEAPLPKDLDAVLNQLRKWNS